MTSLPTLAHFRIGLHRAEAIANGRLGMFAHLKQAHLGPRKQVVELYDSLRPSLFAYLSCLGLRAETAEDVVQESFLRLLVHLAGGGKEENLRGWVFRVAHNLSMDIHRRDPRGTCDDPLDQPFDPADTSLNPEEAALRNEQLSQLEAAIAQLTPQQRHCVLLRAEGLRYREISAVLGISTKRVSELVQRSLVRLLEGR